MKRTEGKTRRELAAEMKKSLVERQRDRERLEGAPECCMAERRTRKKRGVERKSF